MRTLEIAIKTLSKKVLQQSLVGAESREDLQRTPHFHPDSLQTPPGSHITDARICHIPFFCFSSMANNAAATKDSKGSSRSFVLGDPYSGDGICPQVKAGCPQSRLLVRLSHRPASEPERPRQPGRECRRCPPGGRRAVTRGSVTRDATGGGEGPQCTQRPFSLSQMRIPSPASV